MVSNTTKGCVSLILSILIFIGVMTSFVLGAVSASVMCPDACTPKCPDTCKINILDTRMLIPIVVCGILSIVTFLFCIRSIWITFEYGKLDMGQLPHGYPVYNRENLIWHAWTVFVISFGLIVINGLIIMGFLVQGRNWNYNVLIWLDISFHFVAGFSICWCWYPFGAAKKEKPYIPITSTEWTKTAPDV